MRIENMAHKDDWALLKYVFCLAQIFLWLFSKEKQMTTKKM